MKLCERGESCSGAASKRAEAPYTVLHTNQTHLGLEDKIKHAGPDGGGFVLDENFCWAHQQLAKNSVKKVENVPAPFLNLEMINMEESWITKKVCC